jgi:very-short-patch-repair endonuclease
MNKEELIPIDNYNKLFTKNIDELVVYFTSRKDLIKRYIKKYFHKNINYIEVPYTIQRPRGGRPRIDIMVTDETFNLVKKSYSLKTRYDPHHQVSTIMSLENQTIGFIANAFSGIYSCERQYVIGPYFVDMLVESDIVVECDEDGHNDRNPVAEVIREQYIMEQGKRIVRFNPNASTFDLSNVIQCILKMIHNKNLQ